MTDCTLLHGDCLEEMAAMDAGSVDAVVTDPPYGIGFMGKAWDTYGPEARRLAEEKAALPCHVPNRNRPRGGSFPQASKATSAGSYDVSRAGNVRFQEWCAAWSSEALRVLKPSHYLLAFGGTRTWHRLACAIEDAGFEIRDTLMWLHGQGFPKGKSCLKPAWEPIILARKPGPKRELGIEECRVGTTVETWPASRGYSRHDPGSVMKSTQDTGQSPAGRWPANLILECTCDETRGSQQAACIRRRIAKARPSCHGPEPVRIHTDPNCPCAMLDAQTGTRKASGLYEKRVVGDRDGPASMKCTALESSMYADSGGASRFFLNVKGEPCDVSTAERTFDLQSERAASALSDAVTSASHGAIVSSGYRAPSMSVTPSAFARIITTVITLTTSIAPECLPASLHISITAAGDHASPAATPSPTGTMTITLGRSKSGGSAEVVTSNIMQQSAEVGALDSDGQPRFRYVAKASRSKRNKGLDDPGPQFEHGDTLRKIENKLTGRGNFHPTVKPVSLMRWLVRLVARPGDVVVDPFAGSGTTGVACVMEGREFIGIDQDAEYIEISRRRIEYARRRIDHASAQGRLPLDESPPLAPDAGRPT